MSFAEHVARASNLRFVHMYDMRVCQRQSSAPTWHQSQIRMATMSAKEEHSEAFVHM